MEFEQLEKIYSFMTVKQFDVNTALNSQKTKLHIAIEKGCKGTVQQLIDSGVDINNTSPAPALFVAIAEQNFEIINLLIENGAAINFESKWIFRNPSYNRFGSNSGYTPLHVGIETKNERIVELLLKKGALVNYKSDQDFPLHVAIERSSINVVMKLIEFGAEINSPCCGLLNPLLHAIQAGKVDAFKLLVSRGASLNTRTFNRESLLNFAIYAENGEEIIEFLLHRGANVNETNSTGLLPLCYMIFKNMNISDKLFELFLDCGTDLNHQSLRGDTILHLLLQKEKFFGKTELLISYGANINAVNKENKTPYYYIVHQLINLIQDFCSYELAGRHHQDMLRPMAFNLCHENYNVIPSKRNPFDPQPYRLVVQLLTKEIAKLVATGKTLHPENQSLIESPFVKPYYQICKSEIDAMKKVNVCNSVTFFDILTANEMKLIGYAGDKELTLAVDNQNYYKLFPKYAELISNQLLSGREKANLLEAGVKSFKKIVKFQTPVLITYKIFNYLRAIDLKHFSEACNTTIEK